MNRMVRMIFSVIAMGIALGLPLQLSLAQVASSYEAPIEPTAKPLAGYDAGFYMRSPDDAFRLQVYSRLQFQHLYEDNRNPAAGEVDLNTFKMRRAYLILMGTLFKQFEFLTLIGHVTGRPTLAVSGGGGGTVGNPNAPFWIAEMHYKPHTAFNIMFGHISIPMDRFGETSSGKLAMIEAPITATQADSNPTTGISREPFGAAMTVGLRAYGAAGPFNYIVGVGNGEDFKFVNSTRHLAYGARVWVNVIGDPGDHQSDLAYSQTPQLAIGAGTSFDPQNETATIPGQAAAVTLDWSWQSSGDLLFKWRGLTILGEAYLRKLKIAGAFTQDDFGYTAQAGYFILPKKLELVGRGAQIFREGPSNNSYEFGGGLNWYIQGNNIKLQVDATRVVSFDPTLFTSPATTATPNKPYNRYRTMLTFQI